MIDYSCFNWDGDEDCKKCAARGYIFSCPDECQDYMGFYPKNISNETDMANGKKK